MATSLRLPPELEADVKQLASEHERSEHAEMVYALRIYVAQQKHEKELLMSKQQACVISLGLPLSSTSEELSAALDHLHSMFGYAHMERGNHEYECICAAPKALSYEEAFVVLKKKYYEVGWVYADSIK